MQKEILGFINIKIERERDKEQLKKKLEMEKIKKIEKFNTNINYFSNNNILDNENGNDEIEEKIIIEDDDQKKRKINNEMNKNAITVEDIKTNTNIKFNPIIFPKRENEIQEIQKSKYHHTLSNNLSSKKGSNNNRYNSLYDCKFNTPNNKIINSYNGNNFGITFYNNSISQKLNLIIQDNENVNKNQKSLNTNNIEQKLSFKGKLNGEENIEKPAKIDKMMYSIKRNKKIDYPENINQNEKDDNNAKKDVVKKKPNTNNININNKEKQPFNTKFKTVLPKIQNQQKLINKRNNLDKNFKAFKEREEKKEDEKIKKLIEKKKHAEEVRKRKEEKDLKNNEFHRKEYEMKKEYSNKRKEFKDQRNQTYMELLDKHK